MVRRPSSPGELLVAVDGVLIGMRVVAGVFVRCMEEDGIEECPEGTGKRGDFPLGRNQRMAGVDILLFI